MDKRNKLYVVLGLSIAGILLFAFLVGFSKFAKYDVEFVEYSVEAGETMHSIVADVNSKYEKYYDPRDLVDMMIKENNLKSNNIYAGESYKVPVIKGDGKNHVKEEEK